MKKINKYDFFDKAKKVMTLGAPLAVSLGSIRDVFCDSLLQMDAATPLKTLCDFYCDRLFLILFLVCGVVALAIVRDEKAKKIWIGAWIGTVVAYVVCKATTGGMVQDTANELSGWFGGATE